MSFSPACPLHREKNAADEDGETRWARPVAKERGALKAKIWSYSCASKLRTDFLIRGCLSLFLKIDITLAIKHSRTCYR